MCLQNSIGCDLRTTNTHLSLSLPLSHSLSLSLSLTHTHTHKHKQTRTSTHTSTHARTHAHTHSHSYSPQARLSEQGNGEGSVFITDVNVVGLNGPELDPTGPIFHQVRCTGLRVCVYDVACRYAVCTGCTLSLFMHICCVGSCVCVCVCVR